MSDPTEDDTQGWLRPEWELTDFAELFEDLIPDEWFGK